MDDSSTTTSHRHAWDLIPWVVAGSASDAERQLVEEHAALCADCRDELSFHRSLQNGIAGAAVPPHSPEPALRRLWARIDEAEPASRPLLALGARRVGWNRLLAAAVVVQAIGLAALLGMLWERPRPADYQTLSQSLARTAPAASIRLVPAASLQLGELQALLARAGLQVVESSGDGAILGLAPRPGASTPVGETLLRLRAEPGVLLAEPILDATTPRP